MRVGDDLGLDRPSRLAPRTRIERSPASALPNSLGLPEDGVWEVTYEVLGGEDGATIDTFNIYGDGQYDIAEGNASTPNVNTVLRVRVTDVEDISGFD